MNDIISLRWFVSNLPPISSLLTAGAITSPSNIGTKYVAEWLESMIKLNVPYANNFYEIIG